MRERFVIRLNRSLSNEALVDLNNHFTDILPTGKIVQRVALPKENDELETLDLPRLISRRFAVDLAASVS